MTAYYTEGKKNSLQLIIKFFIITVMNWFLNSFIRWESRILSSLGSDTAAPTEARQYERNGEIHRDQLLRY
jgi:hypothetical protein